MAWINRHFERFIVTALALTVAMEAERVFVKDHIGLQVGVELMLLAWFVLAPVIHVWWSLRDRDMQHEPLRGSMVYLLVCGYLGILMALTIGR